MLVEIYTKSNCIFCVKAKHALENNQMDYIEYSLDDPEQKRLLLERNSAAKTAPQIYIDGMLIGGYTQLAEWLNNNRKMTFLVE